MDASSEGEALNAVGRLSGKAALTRLYEEQATDAIRLAFLLVGDRDQAEDLVHDAFARIVRRFQHRRHPYDFAAYLKRAVVNQAASRARRRKLEARFLDRERSLGVVSNTPPPDFEQRDVLLKALLQLPESQRLVVVLRIYEDLSEKEVAKRLRISPAAVRSTLHRAMTTLRQTLKEPLDERN